MREAFDAHSEERRRWLLAQGQYPNEMWIDGIYMGEPFLVNYGRLFDDAAFGNDMAVFQSTLVAEHCLDPKTGLLYHAWDQDRNAAWADPKTGRSPVIWGRGMGWFVMAMVDILEQLPAIAPRLSAPPRPAEEERRGPGEDAGPEDGPVVPGASTSRALPGNWIETSSSGMFIYAIRKAVRLKLVEPSYLPVAERAWKGLQATFEQDAAGRPVFTGAVQGMGVQKDAAGYLAVPRLKNSTHGLMAAMIAASEMEPGRATPAAFRDWPAGALPAEVGRRVAENFAARPFERPNGVRHLPRGLRVVRLADARGSHARRPAARAAGAEVRSAVHAGRGEARLAAGARGLPRVRHGAPRDLPPDEGPAVPRSRPQLRRQAVGNHDAGRHHDRGALLD